MVSELVVLNSEESDLEIEYGIAHDGDDSTGVDKTSSIEHTKPAQNMGSVSAFPTEQAEEFQKLHEHSLSQSISVTNGRSKASSENLHAGLHHGTTGRLNKPSKKSILKRGKTACAFDSSGSEEDEEFGSKAKRRKTAAIDDLDGNSSYTSASNRRHSVSFAMNEEPDSHGQDIEVATEPKVYDMHPPNTLHQSPFDTLHGNDICQTSSKEASPAAQGIPAEDSSAPLPSYKRTQQRAKTTHDVPTSSRDTEPMSSESFARAKRALTMGLLDGSSQLSANSTDELSLPVTLHDLVHNGHPISNDKLVASEYQTGQTEFANPHAINGYFSTVNGSHDAVEEPAGIDDYNLGRGSQTMNDSQRKDVFQDAQHEQPMVNGSHTSDDVVLHHYTQEPNLEKPHGNNDALIESPHPFVSVEGDGSALPQDCSPYAKERSEGYLDMNRPSEETRSFNIAPSENESLTNVVTYDEPEHINKDNTFANEHDIAPDDEDELGMDQYGGMPKEMYKPRPSRSRSRNFEEYMGIEPVANTTDDNNESTHNLFEQNIAPKTKKRKVKRGKTMSAALLKKPREPEVDDDVIWIDEPSEKEPVENVQLPSPQPPLLSEKEAHDVSPPPEGISDFAVVIETDSAAELTPKKPTKRKKSKGRLGKAELHHENASPLRTKTGEGVEDEPSKGQDSARCIEQTEQHGENEKGNCEASEDVHEESMTPQKKTLSTEPGSGARSSKKENPNENEKETKEEKLQLEHPVSLSEPKLKDTSPCIRGQSPTNPSLDTPKKPILKPTQNYEKGPDKHSPITRNKRVPYRVGLSKRDRIAPLLKVIRK
ncbi:hypothetical protein KEM55_002699 [Ascosphaera atra]|nr:hypothetical protein KEM55_002699 [Ascosphaera atra]